MRVAVLVLGDVGRSPRMQYHALSLANSRSRNEQINVDLIGYSGSDCRREIRDNPNIHLHLIDPSPIKNMPSFVQKVFFLRILAKVFIQFFQLLSLLLFRIDRPEYLLVQTPPAIPTLIIAHFVCFCRRTKLIIDWHNYGYTLLEASKRNVIIVQTYKFIEFLFGKGAYHNFCVTEEMKRDLQERGIRASELHDKPPSFFKKASTTDKHQLLLKLQSKFEEWGVKYPASTSKEEHTFLTYRDIATDAIYEKPLLSKKDSIKARDTVLLISSTSWTEDEDFSILLDALIRYSNRAADLKKAGKQVKKIILVVTGRGEQREFYENEMRKHQSEFVHMLTMWLEPDDYPTLLGCSDLGVCLHYSSSGLDLPMKVVDMFGAELPVCAVHFNCLHELVVHENNGMVFHNSVELYDQIFNLFNAKEWENMLSQMRHHITTGFLRDRWESHWRTHALPIFQQS